MLEICVVSCYVVKFPPWWARLNPYAKAVFQWQAMSIHPTHGEYLAAWSSKFEARLGEDGLPGLFLGERPKVFFEELKVIEQILLREEWEPIETGIFEQKWKRETQ